MSEYLDKASLAAESGLGVRNWERIIAQKKIATVRIGRRVVVRRADFIDFMESQKIPAIAPSDIRAQLELIAEQALQKQRRAS